MRKTKKTDKRKYSIWSAFVFSFFSKDLYQDVGKKWKGTGFGYLVLIVALIWIPRAAWWQCQICDGLPGFVQQIPQFKIEKGVFSSSVKQPYFLLTDNSGLIVDTTGKINSLAQVPGIEKMQ